MFQISAVLKSELLRSSVVKLYSPFHELCDHVKGVAGPDVADGVAALVGRAVDGVGGAGAPLIVWQSGVRLESVTERNIKHLFIKNIQIK